MSTSCDTFSVMSPRESVIVNHPAAYVHITYVYTEYSSFLVPKDAAPCGERVGTKNEL